MAKKKTTTTKKSGKTKKAPNPLFPSRPKNFKIGQDVLPKKRDLGRYVRWPRYVRIQRQRKILLQRLKVPPSINQFSHTLDRNQASDLFRLFDKYRPETKAQKKERLKAIAEKAAGDASAKSESEKPPPVIKFGLKHVTTLIEEKKAKLVAIACDVDPLELVLWLPALCRKMDVPFCIVKNKGRLGTLVHMKKASAICLTEVNSEDEGKLKKLAEICKAEYNDNMAVLKKWGGGIMGLKTQAKLAKREAALAAERAKKEKMML